MTRSGGTSPDTPKKRKKCRTTNRVTDEELRRGGNEGGRLGIFTKTHVILTAQGVQRSHDFFFYGTMRHCFGFGGVLDYTHSNIKIYQKMIII